VTPHVHITGLGCVSPFGEGMSALRKGLRTGRDPEKPGGWQADGYRVQAVHHAPLKGVSVLDPALPLRFVESACDQAVRDAALAPDGSLNLRLRGIVAGLALASTSCGWHRPEITLRRGTIVGADVDGGADADDCFSLDKDGPAAHLVRRYGLTGPIAVLSSACAASTGALAWAGERLIAGEADVMLVGGVDVLTEVVFLGFHSMRLLGGQTRPFAADREGFVLAEGSAFLVLESDAHIRAHGRAGYATLRGWGASADAHHITTPAAAGIARSIAAALGHAAVPVEDLTVFHAHGTSSAASDRAEYEALNGLLGGRVGRVRVTATKAALGHTEGVAGLFTALVAADTIARGRLSDGVPGGRPVTDPPGLALSSAGEPWPTEPAVVHASGFGGVNCSVVIGAPSLSTCGPKPHPVQRPVRMRVTAIAREDAAAIVALGGQPATGTVAIGPPAWPATPRPDSQCRRVGEVVGALLAAVPAGIAENVRRGGLVSGTRYGAQARHVAMLEAAAKCGPRRVDPLLFASSTYNSPAALSGMAFGITGQIETFVGATSGVEALLTAAHLVSSGRAEAVAAVAYDAAENRVWRYVDDEPIPDLAVGVLLDPSQEPGSVELTAYRRLPPTGQQGCYLQDLMTVVNELCPGSTGVTDPIWVDGGGLAAGQRTEVDDCYPVHLLPTCGSSAATSLELHVNAITEVASGRLDAVTVVSTGRNAPTLLLRYARGICG